MQAVFPAVMLALYGVASVIYVTHLFWHADRVRQLGRLALALGLVANVGTIGARCIAGSHPLLDTSGMLSLTGLLLGTTFIACSFRWRAGVLGAAVAPLVLTLAVASALTLQARHPLLGDPWPVLRHLHLTLAAVGAAAFGMAAAVSLVYLWQEAALKAGRPGRLRRGPAIVTLDRLGRRLVLGGFSALTLAMITGAVWAARLPGNGLRPDWVISGVTWLIFAVLIVARMTVGLRGRRAAMLTLVGVATIGLVLTLYVGRRMMSG